jgi:hypothetical protein
MIKFVSMKIEQYISQLLYRYQCVTVPGFGAFLTETQPAHLHESSNAFYPPKKLISFNSYIRHNDGLLANHIATAERTSYDNALDAIQSEVGIWKNILEINDKFTLKNIGELSLNAEKNVVFSPYEQLNYLTDAFGLNSFVSPVIKREHYKQEAEAIEEKAPIAFTPETRANRNWMKYAAVFVLALAVAGGVTFKLHQDKVAEETLVVQQQVQHEIQNKLQEATFFIESPMPAVSLSVTDAEEKADLPYHVVSGAFKRELNAQKATDALLEKGYQARKLDKNKHGLYPVVYGSYATYREAKAAMVQIQRGENPSAWLLVEKK